MATRTSCNFGVEPPLFTPADRVQALHEVAQAARCVRGRNLLVSLDGLLDRLDLALKRLDEIEAYLGVPGREAGA